MNTYQHLNQQYLFDLSHYLKEFINSQYGSQYADMKEMFNYHLCLDDPIENQGKRIRPILTLICSTGIGLDSAEVLPVAASIELIHNFSLIHDDIEDNGIIRRGKAAVWQKWGLAQALNIGDAMFNSAFIVLLQLSNYFSSQVVLDAVNLLSVTCKKLTKGQYLDIGFESRENVFVVEYFSMIEGKTASLLACSTEMGTILAELEMDQKGIFREYGRSLGMAFQIYDDWLGIWGDHEKTGKSTMSDLREKKKTLPILLGTNKSQRFLDIFRQPDFSDEDIIRMAIALQEDGIEREVIEESRKFSRKALAYIEEMDFAELQKQQLIEITNKLLMRTK